MRVRAAGKRRRQRMLDRRPRPLQLRGAEQRIAADAADDQAGRRLAGGGLEYRAGLRGRRPEARAGRVRRPSRAGIGAIGHASSTVEELHLLAKLVRGLGSESIDHRTRHADFGNAAPAGHARWLGTSIASLSKLDRAFVIGSFLRKDHPLLAQRLRQAVRHGAQADEPARRARRLGDARGRHADRRARGLAGAAGRRGRRGGQGARCAGAAAGRSRRGRAGRRPTRCCPASARPSCWATPRRSTRRPRSCWRWRSWIGEHTGASVGYLGEAGNGVGAQLVGALPGAGGLNAGQMLSQPMKALLLLNTEPVLDSADAAAARAGAGRRRAWWWR